MKPITFSVACKSGHIDVEAYPTRTPGLVVHRRIRSDLTVATRGQWVIAHVGSGWALDQTTFPSRPVAIGVANLLGDSIDWTRDADSLQGDPQVELSVEAAYRGALISRPVKLEVKG